MMPEIMTLQERIAELVEEYGSLRRTARVVHIGFGHLHRIAHGETVNPGKDTLRRLGMRRIVIYEKIKP